MNLDSVHASDLSSLSRVPPRRALMFCRSAPNVKRFPKFALKKAQIIILIFIIINQAQSTSSKASRQMGVGYHRFHPSSNHPQKLLFSKKKKKPPKLGDSLNLKGSQS